MASPTTARQPFPTTHQPPTCRSSPICSSAGSWSPGATTWAWGRPGTTRTPWGVSEAHALLDAARAAQRFEPGEDVAPYDRLLTERGVEELAYLDDHCVMDILPYYAGIPSEELFRVDDWGMTMENGENSGDLNAVGKSAPIAPILPVHGTADTSVPGNFILPWTEFACESQPVQVNWYEGPHRVFYDPATGAADDVLAWIDGRLAGEEPPSVCGDIPLPPA